MAGRLTTRVCLLSRVVFPFCRIFAWLPRLRVFGTKMDARRETVTCGFHHSICRMVFAWCPTTPFCLLLGRPTRDRHRDRHLWFSPQPLQNGLGARLRVFIDTKIIWNGTTRVCFPTTRICFFCNLWLLINFAGRWRFLLVVLTAAL